MSLASLIISIFGLVVSVAGLIISILTLQSAKKTRLEVKNRLASYSLRTECTKRIAVLEGAITSILQDNTCDIEILRKALDTISFIQKMQINIGDEFKKELATSNALVKSALKDLRNNDQFDKIELVPIFTDIINSIKKESYYDA